MADYSSCPNCGRKAEKNFPVTTSRFINAREVAVPTIVNNAGQTAVPTAVPQRTPPLAKYMPDNP